MKTIIALLICTSLAIAQQTSNIIMSKTKTKLEFHKGMTKWQEKMRQFNTHNLKKSQDDALQHTTVPLKALEAAACFDVPIASKGNTIELSIIDTSALSVEDIKIEVTSIPDGINFKEKTSTLAALMSKEEQTVTFTFSVDKTAKVNKIETLHFAIMDKAGQQWTKDIAIKITPPATYELFQNYPNPFNPTTTIEYQLPGTGIRFDVSLKIYDAIGREVANLVNEQQDPGYYQKTFDASRYASGMYVYRLIAKDNQDKEHVFHKKMILLR